MNTADQYLKAIYVVQERSNGGRASTGELADILGVSPASVNEMIGKLQDQGLVEHEKYKGVTLTGDGEVRGRDALQTYCILEHFLRNVLGVEEYRAEARQLEPVIDETVADRLDMIVDRSASCPECFAPEADSCVHLGPEDAIVGED